jgi:hypothetical protein
VRQHSLDSVLQRVLWCDGCEVLVEQMVDSRASQEFIAFPSESSAQRSELRFCEVAVREEADQ